MSLTRRSVLRQLGALSAAQPLAALGTALTLGCKEKQPPPPPPVTQYARIRILFEGPWLFHPRDESLVATTFADASHDCRYGLWDTPSNAIAKPASMPGSTDWKAEPIPGSPTFAKSYEAAAVAAKSVFIDPEVVKGPVVIKSLPTDRNVSLPMPDQVTFSARLSTAVVTENNKKLDTEAPYITTVLTYNRPVIDGKAPSIPIRKGSDTIIAANPANDLIFEMYHPTNDGMSDVQHIETAFANLVSRIQNEHGKPYPIKLTVQNGCVDPSSDNDRTSDTELGVKPCPAPPPPGTLRPQAVGFSNCAGGGLGARGAQGPGGGN